MNAIAARKQRKCLRGCQEHKCSASPNTRVLKLCASMSMSYKRHTSATDRTMVNTGTKGHISKYTDQSLFIHFKMITNISHGITLIEMFSYSFQTIQVHSVQAVCSMVLGVFGKEHPHSAPIVCCGQSSENISIC